jgi:hypothetical protein
MLAITALTKMRGHEKISSSFSGRIIQMFEHKKSDIEFNFSQFKQLISRLDTPQINQNKNGVNSLLWVDVSSEKIKDFLSTYRNDFHNMDIIRSYIEKQNSAGLLVDWSVAISVKPNSIGNDIFWNGGKMNIGWSNRKIDDIETPTLNVGGGKNAILFKEHKIIDLEEQYTIEPKTEAEITDLRMKFGKPLIVFIPISPIGIKDVTQKSPIISYGIIFPKIESEQNYEYAARPLSGMEDEVQISNDPADEE